MATTGCDPGWAPSASASDLPEPEVGDDVVGAFIVFDSAGDNIGAYRTTPCLWQRQRFAVRDARAASAATAGNPRNTRIIVGRRVQ